MTEPYFQCGSIDRIVFKITSSLKLKDVLTTITQALVNDLNISRACAWLVAPGNRCENCPHKATCGTEDHCLQLKSRAGEPNKRPLHECLPLKNHIISNMVRERMPLSIDANHGQMRDQLEHMFNEDPFHSCRVYPVVFRDELLGVLTAFSEDEIISVESKHFSLIANQAAIAIKNAKLFQEVEQLKNRLEVENCYLKQEIGSSYHFRGIIGESRVFKEVLRQAEEVAQTDASVLLLSETGAGKELLARTIHGMSPAGERALICVNCPALSPALVESELFGHEKGSYTGAISRKIGKFEVADGGTIFLDEIGALPLELQAKFLRVLQEGEFERIGGHKSIKVSARVIAATNQNLEVAILNGNFREDLYYRLNVFPITIPPLRERKEDIPLLLDYFIKKYCVRFGRSIVSLPRQTILKLQEYHWPGNVRELENMVERAVILSRTTHVDFEAFFRPHPDDSPSGHATLQDIERTHILRTLRGCNWVVEGKNGAAIRTGLNPSTLRSRMKKLGIARPPKK